MPRFYAILLSLLTVPSAQAMERVCRNPAESLERFQTARDADARSLLGTCLVRYHIDQPEVARAALRVLRDPKEDVLLKEDLIIAFADAPLRHKVHVERELASAMDPAEKAAVDRNVGSVGAILAAAQAVKSMDDITPATKYEAEFFRAISEIALSEESHVLLRATAVDALARLSERVVKSGLYDEKSLRAAREALQVVASRDDESSYFAHADVALARLENAGVPGSASREPAPARMISSVKSSK